MRRRQLLGRLIALGLTIGVILGLSALRPTPAQAKTSQAVTWYRQWQKAYVGGKTQKYVRMNDGNGATTVVSESQGYGMLAAVLAAKKGVKSHTTFNQFYRYYRAHRISKQNPLMCWQQTKKNGKLTSVGSQRNSATDGDLDIAYALILADRQWGSKKTNYKAGARAILKAIKKSEINSTTKLPLMGNWATNSYDRSKLRTSDLMTGYFKTFAKFTGDKSWNTVAKRSQKLVKKLSARHKTGSFPDFIRVTGAKLKLTTVRAYQIESATDNQYGYNACRVPWRLAQTYKLTKDGTTKKALKKQLKFFNRKQRLTAGYTLGGKAVNNYTNPAFTAPAKYGAQVLKQTSLKRKLSRQLPTKIQKKSYFGATIQVLTALQ
ncbi:endoglucanase [Levilactobacillus suantsaii]|uniref:glycosyl hydrolase family 8 n=1 Tax=Levilactobacillus suantsaii TaxID=2292255 RepID=UPI0015F3F0D1|nr:glycosyl hydrolase family 8 [Levilactobacillus suantsaii]QMU08254.1 endoglucanase [Levilactobacillus suantsaii]